MPLRQGAARDVADLYFFETVVRVHRAGEGAPYTGLKPAGLSEGPIIPLAEKAEEGKVDELVERLCDDIRNALNERFAEVMRLRGQADGPVPAARQYVEAMLGFEVYAHTLHTCAMADAHEHHGRVQREHEEHSHV